MIVTSEFFPHCGSSKTWVSDYSVHGRRQSWLWPADKVKSDSLSKCRRLSFSPDIPACCTPWAPVQEGCVLTTQQKSADLPLRGMFMKQNTYTVHSTVGKVMEGMSLAQGPEKRVHGTCNFSLSVFTRLFISKTALTSLISGNVVI